MPISDASRSGHATALQAESDRRLYRQSDIRRLSGFDPLSVDPGGLSGLRSGIGLPPNNGEGFAKNLGGNELPNAPHFTTSLSAEYTMPVSEDWAATLHSDFYWQSQSFARVFQRPAL